jgi:hypothetical protein
MNELWEIIVVFAVSMVKFGFGGVPAAVGAQFSFLKAFTINVGGGVSGTFLFCHLSDYFLKRARQMAEKRRQQLHKPPKKKFTRMNKLIIRTKHKMGLTGLALLTPSLLSIPLGTLLAVRYFKNKQKIIQYMILSIIAWEFFFYFLWKYVVIFLERIF